MKTSKQIPQQTSTEAEAIQLHPVTLAFREDQTYLEKAFLSEDLNQALPLIRFICLFALLIYGIFGILDTYLVPEQKHLFWIFRYAIFTPICLLIFSLSFFPVFKKISSPLLTFLGIFSGCGILMMIALAPPAAGHTYYAGLILVIMISYTLVKLRLIWATFTGWFLVLLYEIVAISFCNTPLPVLLNNNFFLIAANIIGMTACYSIERRSRQDFFLKHLLKIEREKVLHARNELEEKVVARTAQLVEVNDLLHTEIAERKQVQSQLVRHQKMESIGLVAGNVAHDLNNILSGIIGYPELLLMDLPKDSKLRQPLEQILNSGQRAAAIVADLLTIARGVSYQREITNINDLITSYLDSPEHKKSAALHSNVTVQLNLKPNIANCTCSPVHIQKVLMNLINNGFEAIVGQGRIYIHTSEKTISTETEKVKLLPPGTYVMIQVTDTGSGIPEEMMLHIFEPFYTRKKAGRSGTGLGLAVVWNTMQEHNGIIDVSSDQNETTFSAYLPATDEISKGHPTGNLEDLYGSATILIIDDEDLQRDLGLKLLTALGYTATTMASGEQAVDYLQTHKTDLLLLDMIMEPGIGGLDTYREIIKLHPEQKVIVASGYSESQDVQAILEMGFGVFLKKPYNIVDLGTAVKLLLVAA